MAIMQRLAAARTPAATLRWAARQHAVAALPLGAVHGVVGKAQQLLVVLGVIGEYLGRIYAETKRRPLFLLKESSSHGVPLAVTTALGPEHEDRFGGHEELEWSEDE